MKSALSCVVLSLALTGLLRAGEEAKCEGKCTASEKLTRVLASWKAVSEAAKNSCPDELAKVQSEFAAVAKQCPIGSRMGETMAFVKSVLESAAAADEACAKTCPLAAKEGNATAASTTAASDPAAPSATLCEASKLKAARTQLLTSLREVAGHVASAAPACSAGSACCAAKEALASVKSGLCESKAGEIVAKIRAETCDKGAAAIVLKEIEGLKCETKAGEIVASIRAEKCDVGAAQILVKAYSEVSGKAEVCCQDLAARATVLKASWGKVPAELKEMCPQKHQELMASIGALSQKSKTVALMPETVAALTDGFEALVGVNGKMVEWAKANPDALKDVPCEAKKAFETQNALIQEANDILHRVMTASGNFAGPGAQKKTETASAK